MRKQMLVALVFTSLSVGCSDHPTDTVLAPSPANAVVYEGNASLGELTRAVALAMQNAGLRQQIRNDLRDSRSTREHKLELANYLNGKGGILLAQMARATGKTHQEILALLQATPPLEFYMPVPEHRATWQGGADVLVASALDDDAVLFAYSPQGQAVALSVAAPPATPTLVLVPVETDFSKPLGKRYQNTQDHGGTTIGTMSLCLTCVAEDPNFETGGGSIPPEAGIYMTYSYVDDLGESWTKGAPEVEVISHTTDNVGVRVRTCANESHEPPRKFNQDNHTWTGKVLLFSKDEAYGLGIVAPTGQQKAVYTVWENDHVECEVETSIDLGGSLAASALFAAGMYGAVDCINNVGGLNDKDGWGLLCLITGIYTAGWLFWPNAQNLIYTNDDLIGLAATRETINNPGFDGVATHILLKENGSRNGAINLKVMSAEEAGQY
jgi:hypothetical protein